MKRLLINLGNPTEISIYELATLVNRLTHNAAGIRFLPQERVPTDPQRRRPDITHAIEQLNWVPQIDLETGLARLIEDFRRQPSLC